MLGSLLLGIGIFFFLLVGMGIFINNFILYGIGMTIAGMSLVLLSLIVKTDWAGFDRYPHWLIKVKLRKEFWDGFPAL